MDFRHRFNGETALRSPGRREVGIQPDEAWTAVARLSHAFHRKTATRVGGRSASGQSDSDVVCPAGFMDIAGWTGPGEPADVFEGGLQLGYRTCVARSREPEDRLHL